MDPAVVLATTQALVMTAASNMFAQGWTAYHNKNWASLDLTTFAHFLVFTTFTTPPNYWWQKWLEDTFPMNVVATRSSVKEKDETRRIQRKEFSVTNTFIKFLLDQTLGCWLNNLAFMTIMPLLNGRSPTEIIWTLQRDFVSLVIASYTFWPLVCLANFMLVPFRHRMMVGNLASFAWGVYMSLIST